MANTTQMGPGEIAIKIPQQATGEREGMIGKFLSVLALVIVCTPANVVASERGPVTNLPLPRYVSMKAPKGNVRRGPSLTHRVDWVFKRVNMPLQIIAEYGHWRRVLDWEGEGGWMHYSLLSGVRTVLVKNDLTALLAQPQSPEKPNAYVEQGVVAQLGKCGPDWCHIKTSGYKGWVLKSAIWGVFDAELRD